MTTPRPSLLSTIRRFFLGGVVAWALFLSVLLHLMLFLVPWTTLGKISFEAPVIVDIQNLPAPPKPTKPQPVKPKEQRPPPPPPPTQDKPPEPPPETPATNEPAINPESKANTTPPAPSQPSSIPILKKPLEVLPFLAGQLVYEVTESSNETYLGKLYFSWKFNEDGYIFDAIAKSGGLAGMLYPIELRQTTIGEIRGTQGFLPSRYSYSNSRKNDGNAYSTSFLWSLGMATTVDGDLIPIPENTQDGLSAILQLGLMVASGAIDEGTPPVQMAIMTNRGLRYGLFHYKKRETLTIGGQSIDTIHVVAKEKGELEVWVAPSLGLMPVKFRSAPENTRQLNIVLEKLPQPADNVLDKKVDKTPTITQAPEPKVEITPSQTIPEKTTPSHQTIPYQ